MGDQLSSPLEIPRIPFLSFQEPGVFFTFFLFQSQFRPPLPPRTRGGRGGRGAVHLPGKHSHGLSQENTFSPPGSGFRIKARLLGEGQEGRLLSVGDSRVEVSYYDSSSTFRKVVLSKGEALSLGPGVLIFHEVRLWNGYIVHYDPSLGVFLLASGLAVGGLLWVYLPTRGERPGARG